MPMLYGQLESCPRCRQPESYGRCQVSKKGLVFRCNACRHFEVKPLPAIRKKIIYVDQFALSKMVKSKDDDFWADLYQRLTKLTANEVVTCPFSPVHVEESNFDFRHRDALKTMYRKLAGDDEFRRAEDIEKRQLARSLHAFIGCTKSKATDLFDDDAFDSSPHRWSEVFHLHLDFPYDDDLIDELRKAKESLHASMQSLRERWQANPVTFEEQVVAETLSFRSAIESYRQQTGGDPDKYWWVTSPLHLDVVNWLARTVQTIDPDEQDPVSVLDRFVESDEFAETPCVYIQSRIWAKIAELVLNPRGSRKPRASDHYDAKVLAIYAPYCDAMLLDGGFREIAIDARVACEKRFGVRIFSEQVRDKFIAYLDDLERSVPIDHYRTLADIYGVEATASHATVSAESPERVE